MSVARIQHPLMIRVPQLAQLGLAVQSCRRLGSGLMYDAAFPVSPAALGRDLRDRLTVFVSTVEAPDLVDCLAGLAKQRCRFRLRILHNVAPMSAAFQAMIDLCDTPYYVQVDEDMALHRHAIWSLYERIVQADDRCVFYCLPLHEPLRDVCLLGVKIFRTELAREFPLDPEAHSCEIDQIRRFEARGYHYRYEFGGFALRDCPSCAGQVNPSWSERYWAPRPVPKHVLLDVYTKFRRDFEKLSAPDNQVDWLRDWPSRFAARFAARPNPLDLFALLGSLDGHFRPGPLRREKDFRAPPAERFEQHYARLACDYREAT